MSPRTAAASQGTSSAAVVVGGGRRRELIGGVAEPTALVTAWIRAADVLWGQSARDPTIGPAGDSLEVGMGERNCESEDFLLRHRAVE